MEITNTFGVAAPVEQVWNVLTDAELVAPCLPGAQLKSSDGDTYDGIVKVKVGPIRMQYGGRAHFHELNETARTIVLIAEGREARGQGTAAATVTSKLTPDGDDRTQVTVHTDLHLTGKVAQFGGDSLSEVSGRLLTQFANNLEKRVLTPRAEDVTPEPKTPSSQATTSTPPQSNAPTPGEEHTGTPDLLRLGGGVMARRAKPYVAVSALFLLIGWTIGRSGQR